MVALSKYIKTYKRYIYKLILEEYLGWIVRWIPGYEGMLIRSTVLSWLCNKNNGHLKIYPGVYFYHSYGIEFGENCAINSGSVIDGRGGITFGKNVLIGPNVSIYSSDHDFEQVEKPMTELPHILKPVIIHDDVWVGANVVITGGVVINKGTVVAAGAVVTKNTEPYSIIGGVPAKVIGKRK